MRKRKIKESPGQIKFFEQVLYNNKSYKTIMEAMRQSYIDFYGGCRIKNIITANNSFSFSYQKRFWEEYEIDNQYIL